MLVSSPQPGAYGTNLFSTFPRSLSLFLLPIPLMISTMLSPAASTYPSYHFIFAILKSFPPPPFFLLFPFFGGLCLPPPTFFFLFILFVSDWAFQFWRRGLQIAGEKESRREKGGRRRERKARATAPRLTDAFQEGQSSLSNRWLREKK